MPVSPELMERIAIISGKGEDKVVLRDLEIPIKRIVKLIAEGETREAILDRYPSLQPEDIRDCLLIAHDFVPGAQDSLPSGMAKLVVSKPPTPEEIEAQKRRTRELMEESDRIRERFGHPSREVDIEVMLEEIDGIRRVSP